jgi:hypothetical protein
MGTEDLDTALSVSKEVYDFLLQFLINMALVFGDPVQVLFTRWY